MSKTTDKIDKLAKQHEIIGIKTNCKYFSNIGNLCSRVENGMMRCDECLECEFKYIDALKEENERLKTENERLNSICLQLQNSELKEHLEKVNCERENYKLCKENEELKKRQITKNGFICDCEQNEKYRKTLEEIKEIVKIAFIVCDDECGNANKFAEIQDKINEVLK